ncbi:hypothetical protein VdG2_08097 [Verticillium dahliae VDG2]|nr:hypothetical protein VdG2_08097 [Verticillium dahliae VDG2]
MPSPTKKRKLNKDASGPTSRGLEYFFSKQKQGDASAASTQPQPKQDVGEAPRSEQEFTDEELARKLQAEWDSEVQNTESLSTESQLVPRCSASPALDPSSTGSAQVAISAATPVEEPKLASTAPKTLSLSSVAVAGDSLSSTIPLDQSPLVFDPSEYSSHLKDHWASEGGDASYALLTRCFILVNSTQSRIKIVDTLVNCIRLIIQTDPESLLPAVWLATNAISPPYISLELGLGGSAISKALKQVCGLNGPSLKNLYDKYGDAGDVAFEAKKKQSFTLRKPKPLTIKAVYQSLVKIANTQDFAVRDRGSLAKLKKEELAEVWAKAEEIVKACFAKRPNYNDLVPILLEIGVCDELLIRCGLTLHIPLRPMLGSITRDLTEMLTKLQGRDFACEYKYDGQRAQIHCDAKGKVSIFSRHLELMTDKYPDLVALMPQIRGEGVDSFVMEGEVVAIDRQTGDMKNFQALTNRARKDVAIGSIQVDVCMYSFDLMYLNGEPLLDRPFRERRELLRSMFIEVPHQFTWVKSLDATSQDSDAVLDFFKSATDIKCEGIMVKILDNLTEVPCQGGEVDAPVDEMEEPQTPSKRKAPGKIAENDTKKKTRRKPLLATYEPDKRLDSWLKVKKDYNASFDTIDMIPVAGWHGQGRKAKWWSPILLAVRNEDSGSFEVVCKCISGFTDTFYKANREFYDDGSGGSGVIQNIRSSKPAFIEYSGPEPDVWFEPQEVWEMAFADVTLSPTYTAAIGLVSEERGLSLRFPRFLKKRDDKGLDEASTNEFLASLFRKQESKAIPAAVDAAEDE